jgi:hypothetical protein
MLSIFTCGGLAKAQQIQLGDASGLGAVRRQHVEVVTDSALVRAGRPEWVEVAFRVDPGLHINSHTPHDELLIPTSLNVEPPAGLKVLGQEYPAGISLRLDVGAGEVLSTYQGEFRVRLQVLAPKGESVLTGALRYQACDNKSCYPPKTLPVKVAVSAR